MGSSTFFMIPDAVYLSRASFSLIRFATGTRCIGICTGETSAFTLKWTGGPRQPRPSKFSGYCVSMSSIVSFPGGARRLLEGIIIGLEGEGVAESPYGLSLSGWSGWQPFVPLSVPLA